VAEVLGEWALGPGRLYWQLARHLTSAIERGVLAPGRRLPSERALARTLHVSRGTVVAAYDLMVGQGQLERRQGSGTFVASLPVPSLPVGREGSTLVHRLVDRSDGPGGLIDLSISVLRSASGLPAMSVTTADLVKVVPDTGLSPSGLPALREALARYLTRLGLGSEAHEIVVTTGAQQAIAVAISCWVRPGDPVLIDDPTYPGALSALIAAGARPIGISVDQEGIRLDELERGLDQRPSLIYLQSAAHSPIGSVLSHHRRVRLAELIERSHVPVIEDQSLAELTWSACPPPLASYCTRSSVVTVGSIDKLFWGGLRVGWARAPAAVALRLARVKATHDLGSSVLSQLMAVRLLEGLQTSTFADDRRADLLARYHVLARNLRTQLPDWEWSEPSGGLSIWARIPEGQAMAFAQVALRCGVAVATADALSCSQRHTDRLRLSFSSRADELEEGVRRLATAWGVWHGQPRPAVSAHVPGRSGAR